MPEPTSENYRFSPLPNARMEKAAWLVAEGDLAEDEIAAEVKITPRQLYNWRQRVDFATRVDEHIAQITKKVLSSGYCRIDKRLELLNRNVRRLERVVAAQAENPEVSSQPGADTGLIVRKDIPTRFGTIQEYSVATGILAEERAHLKHIAVETGDWVERISANFSLDAALGSLLGNVDPGAEGEGGGDHSDVAEESAAGS